MKKSFMNNIKNFVDSNVRQRIDRVSNNNNDFFGDDLLSLENQFEDIRYVCIEAEKKISALLQTLSTPTPLSAYTHNVQTSLNNFAASTSNSPNPAGTLDVHYRAKFDEIERLKLSPTNDISKQAKTGITPTELQGDIRRHKKLPIVGLLKFLNKSRHKTKPDSLLATTLTHCSHIQTQLTQLYLDYEQAIESHCLLPIRQILEVDVPNIVKSRKFFIKSHNDLESIKAKYSAANQRQQQVQSSHSTGNSYSFAQTTVQQVSKLDQLKRESEEAELKYEQSKDAYAAELYAFVCRETELVSFLLDFYRHQAEYQQRIGEVLQKSLPPLDDILAKSPRKVVFGTSLDENLRCTGRTISLVLEICIHILCSNAMKEEGLFRIPGSATKIKKLKNAINAWFVSLASQNDLIVKNQIQKGSNATTLAIYELFKGIAGTKSCQDVSPDIGTTNTASTQTNDKLSRQTVIFDNHAIGGLLKLYLRELPDPLFTHDYYQNWIEATVKTMNEGQLAPLENMIKIIPRSNFCNLRYLFRFLHLLSQDSETNKMTAANLAITMAPSLIWTRSTESNQQSVEQRPINDQQLVESHLNEMQALNAQMSSVGISASLHALVVENLINHAEELFPGPIQFIIPDMDLLAETRQESSSKQDRFAKSTSPTSDSTASSSSYSSVSISSSLERNKHGRKGGSMDGLLRCDKLTGRDIVSSDNASIYPSVRATQSQRQSLQPPPIPPAPVARSQSKQTSDNICSSKQKDALSQSTLKRQQPIDKRAETTSEKFLDRPSIRYKEAPHPNTITHTQSFRGTPSPTSMTKIKSDRPSVPPPSRPMKESETIHQTATSNETKSNQTKSNLSIDNRNPPSHSSSELLRAEYEEINTGDMDDLSITSNSHVVSLDSISADDSSFDQDSTHSLEHSWAECDIERNQPSTSGVQPQAISIIVQSDERKKQIETKPVESADKPELNVPPVKPPRCLSPRVTQSTPL